MIIPKITPDFAVRKTNGAFTATFVTNNGSLVTIGYGDGTTQTSNMPSKTYSGLAPYLLNILSDKTVITSVSAPGQSLTSFSADGLTNVSNINVSTNQITTDDLDQILIALDSFGISGGTLNAAVNSYSRVLSSSATTARANLIAKNWTLTGLPDYWSPYDITTERWYDFSNAATVEVGLGSGTNNGCAGVRDVKNQGNAAYMMAQAVTSSQPIITPAGINGLTTVAFTGNTGEQTLISSGNIPNPTSATIIALYKTGATAPTSNVIFGTDGNSGSSYRRALRESSAHLGTGGGSYSPASTTNTVYVLTADCSTGTGRHSINGNGLVTFSATIDPTTGGRTFYMGGFSGDSITGTISGQLGELIYCTSQLSDDDRNKAVGYLAWKWGIQANLAAGHPHLSTRPLNF
jgi:hypothetical protein